LCWFAKQPSKDVPLAGIMDYNAMCQGAQKRAISRKNSNIFWCASEAYPRYLHTEGANPFSTAATFQVTLGPQHIQHLQDCNKPGTRIVSYREGAGLLSAP